MSYAEEQVRELIAVKRKLTSVLDEMGELEDNLLGFELRYEGDHAMVSEADGNTQKAVLYVEDEDGQGRAVTVTLEELATLLA